MLKRRLLSTLMSLPLALGLTLFQANAYAASYSATDFSLPSGANKSFLYRSTEGNRIELNWTGSSVSAKHSRNTAYLPSSQSPKQHSSASFSSQIQLFTQGIEDETKDLDKKIAKINKELLDLQKELAEEELKNKAEAAEKAADEKTKSIKPSKAMIKLRKKIGETRREITILTRNKSNLLDSKETLMSKPVYNMAYLLSKQPSGIFFLKTGKGLFQVHSEKGQSNETNPLTHRSERYSQVRYVSDLSLEAGSKKIMGGGKTLLSIDKGYQSAPAVITLNSETFRATQIIDSKVRKIDALKKQYPTELTRFSFKGEQLYSSYQQRSETGIAQLQVNYKYTGKKKNLIQITTEGPISIFDPENKSGAKTSHIGVLAETKDKVIELKKQERIDGRIDSQWTYNFKKRYIDNGGDLLSVADIDYYGWEALWYVASYMHRNHVSKRQINFISDKQISSFTLTKSSAKAGGSKVTISRKGTPAYIFELDKIGFVTRYSFPHANQTLELISRDTTTTRANKKRIKDFINQNQLIEINTGL